MFVNMDIIDRSVDTRMASGTDNLAFILSVFVGKNLNNLYTIGLLNNPIFILPIFIEKILIIYTQSGYSTIQFLYCQYLLKKS